MLIAHILEGLLFALQLPIEAIKRLWKKDDASSSILGVLLLVGLVLLLSAVLTAIIWTYTDFSGLQGTAKSIYQLP